MPHLRFRAVEKELVQKLSQSLAKPLAKAMETSEDNFTFEFLHTDFFTNGKADKSYPHIEVHWFERSDSIKENAAQVITDQVRVLTSAADVVVSFHALPKQSYFENGKHF